MTCIATDGRTMAADGLTTSKETICDAASSKIRRLVDGSLAGGAGDCTEIDDLIDWIDDDGPEPTIKESRVLVLRPSGRLELYEGRRAIPIAAPFAIGSGGDIALGAMDHGASPREAVEIAARRDPQTGGTITEQAL